MLVLTRYSGESIYLGDSIKITILKSGNQVKLGIEAPEDVPVVRSEFADGAQESTNCRWTPRS